jgi:hypothetical protein
MHMALLKTTPFRRFANTVAIAATALALMTAASAVPARADMRGDDYARAIAALAVIGIIGAAINDNKRDDHSKAKVYDTRPRVYGERDRDQRHDRRDDRRDDRRATVLPQDCAVEIRGNRHNSTVYLERCLRRSGIDNRLPNACALDVKMRGRTVTAYRENCLERAGFRTRGYRRH